MIGQLLGVVIAAAAADGPTEWVVEGVRIPRPKLVVQRETKKTPPEKPGKPAYASDLFKVMTDFGPFEILYSRYLNRPPEFTGRHPSCTVHDMGLGIPGFKTQWYRGNTVRVLIDGQDVVRSHAADAIEVREGIGVARLRFLWKLPKADVAVHVAVLNGRSEGLVEVAITPHGPIKSVGVNLLCYPGGFGPAYGIPSRRRVRTAVDDASVASGEESRKLALPPRCEWVWYCDREEEDRGLYNTNSVALVLLPEDKARGEITVSSYGVPTQLVYAGTQSRVRLGLAAYPGPNRRARQVFMAERHTVAQMLRTLDFWPGSASGGR